MLGGGAKCPITMGGFLRGNGSVKKPVSEEKALGSTNLGVVLLQERKHFRTRLLRGQGVGITGAAADVRPDGICGWQLDQRQEQEEPWQDRSNGQRNRELRRGCQFPVEGRGAVALAEGRAAR